MTGAKSTTRTIQQSQATLKSKTELRATIVEAPTTDCSQHALSALKKGEGETYPPIPIDSSEDATIIDREPTNPERICVREIV